METSNINNKAVVKPLIYLKTDNNYVSINSIEDQFQYINSIIISDTVTEIDDYAFENNELTSVSIPNSITTIDGRAFTSNQLTRAVIGNKVTNMSGYVFYENPNVTIYVKGISSKPSSWDANWNPDNYPVNWNYAG